MGKINMGRVILGGLVAGIFIDAFEGVLNGVLLANQCTYQFGRNLDWNSG